ncbi:unnamed protein product [Staurois parvus]|uniref:Transmembrane protein n=1 Tax=Staurois parvus TaxID=386267 RepID=A0ABN9AZ62_9NEOB|nr:unnamed protein product [Staurois parvus]
MGRETRSAHPEMSLRTLFSRSSRRLLRSLNRAVTLLVSSSAFPCTFLLRSCRLWTLFSISSLSVISFCRTFLSFFFFISEASPESPPGVPDVLRPNCRTHRYRWSPRCSNTSVSSYGWSISCPSGKWWGHIGRVLVTCCGLSGGCHTEKLHTADRISQPVQECEYSEYRRPRLLLLWMGRLEVLHYVT